MKQKYVLHPGIVSSAAEGKCYFISASTLAHLYGVEFKECRIAAPADSVPPDTGEDREIHIYPDLGQREGGAFLIVTTESPEARSVEKVD